MEIKKEKYNKKEIYSVIDLKDELKGIPKSDRKELKARIGELLVEQILESVADAKTPIQGGEYKRTLSKEYGKFKQEENGNNKANLDLTGEMLSSLDYKIEGNKIKLGIFDSVEAPKADGHNNFSGESKLPTRQFLPKEGQEFKSDIRSLLNETVAAYKADIAPEDKLSQVESKSDLYEFLKDYIGSDFTRAELKSIALGSKKLTEILDDNDLLDLL